MWNIIIIALSLGFLGSMHCVGMCGSLMVYNFASLKNADFGIRFLIYHLFRIFAYGLLGMMFGQIGFIGSLMGIQKVIALILGIVLIYISLSYFFFGGIKIFSGFNIYSWLNQLFGFSSSSYFRYAVSGLVNGFLPCGFSFIAITFSVTTYSLLNGFLFMLFFGLGNIPALFVISALSHNIKFSGNIYRFSMPVIALISGILLILRTMNLGIPYLSPELAFDNKKAVIECHK